MKLLKYLIGIFSDVNLSIFAQVTTPSSDHNKQPPKAVKKKLFTLASGPLIFNRKNNVPDDSDDNLIGSGDLYLDRASSDDDEDVVEDDEDLEQINSSKISNAIKALESFKHLYQHEYKLHEHKLLGHFEKLFHLILNHCVCSDNWLAICDWSSRSVYLILYCLRILLRNAQFQRIFLLAKNSFSCLCQVLLKYVNHYAALNNQILVSAHILEQLLNILTKMVMSDKLTGYRELSKTFFELQIHVSLMQLINTSNDLCLIHGSLNLFLQVASQSGDNKAKLVADLDISDQLLLILQEYDQDSKRLASKLLCLLCNEDKIKSELTHLDGVQILLSLLHNHSNMDILWNIIWCLVQLSSYEENKKEIRLMGGIPLVLSMLCDKNLDPHEINSNKSQLDDPKRTRDG